MLRHEIRGNIHLIGRRRKVTVADEPVDVLPAEARILYGIGTGLHVKAERCPIRNSPLRRVSDSHYRIFILQTHGILLLLFEVVSSCKRW
jgi:hypothetical protein